MRKEKAWRNYRNKRGKAHFTDEYWEPQLDTLHAYQKVPEPPRIYTSVYCFKIYNVMRIIIYI